MKKTAWEATLLSENVWVKQHPVAYWVRPGNTLFIPIPTDTAAADGDHGVGGKEEWQTLWWELGLDVKQESNKPQSLGS